jgi:hypothetical protein
MSSDTQSTQSAQASTLTSSKKLLESESQYASTKIDPTAKDNNQLVIDKKITTDEKTINSKCELQITEEKFKILAERLQKQLNLNLGTVEDTNIFNTKNHHESLKKKIAKIKETLNTNKEALTKLIQQIDNFDKDGSATNSVEKITIDDHTQLLEKINPIKKEIENSKQVLDKLQGSLISKGVFSELNAELETMKKSRTRKGAAIINIDLTKNPADGKDYPEKITGNLYTSSLKLSGRNLKGQKCEVIRVNAKDKIYTVKYVDSNGKPAQLQVKQSELCMVSDKKKHSQ